MQQFLGKLDIRDGLNHAGESLPPLVNGLYEGDLLTFDLDEDGLFNLYAFIEDSLLLELPTVARHENEDECDVKGTSWTYKDESAEEALNPFAVLKDLKGKLNN